MRRSEKGFQLLELVVCLWILSVFLTLVAPPLFRLSAETRLRLAAEEIVAALQRARWLAARRGMNVAVRFRYNPGGAATYAIYRDGNGDGVLNRDIEAGADPEVAPPRRLDQIGRRVGIGLPPGKPVRDPSEPRVLLRQGDDPIRFNRSDLASFGPLGTSTPGSVFVTDGQGGVAAVRVYSRTGKVKVIVYDFQKEVWE